MPLLRRPRRSTHICRNIKTLANFAPPATDDEIRAPSVQFVRKLSGSTHPSRANEAAFNQAVDEVTAAARLKIDIADEPAAFLDEYASVPIAFEVRKILDVAAPTVDLGEFVLSERAVHPPVMKNYDAIPQDRPHHWPRRFDVTNWGLLAARVEGRRVGGAALAFRTPEVEMLEGRDDLAVLWDIRVAPEMRGRGVGSALLRAVDAWTSARGGRWLKVETQNINVPACRFYARHGFVLRAANHSAYPEHPSEIQLLWYKELQRPAWYSRPV